MFSKSRTRQQDEALSLSSHSTRGIMDSMLSFSTELDHDDLESISSDNTSTITAQPSPFRRQSTRKVDEISKKIRKSRDRVKRLVLEVVIPISRARQAILSRLAQTDLPQESVDRDVKDYVRDVETEVVKCGNGIKMEDNGMEAQDHGVEEEIRAKDDQDIRTRVGSPNEHTFTGSLKTATSSRCISTNNETGGQIMNDGGNLSAEESGYTNVMPLSHSAIDDDLDSCSTSSYVSSDTDEDDECDIKDDDLLEQEESEDINESVLGGRLVAGDEEAKDSPDVKDESDQIFRSPAPSPPARSPSPLSIILNHYQAYNTARQPSCLVQEGLEDFKGKVPMGGLVSRSHPTRGPSGQSYDVSPSLASTSQLQPPIQLRSKSPLPDAVGYHPYKRPLIKKATPIKDPYIRDARQSDDELLDPALSPTYVPPKRIAGPSSGRQVHNMSSKVGTMEMDINEKGQSPRNFADGESYDGSYKENRQGGVNEARGVPRSVLRMRLPFPFDLTKTSRISTHPRTASSPLPPSSSFTNIVTAGTARDPKSPSTHSKPILRLLLTISPAGREKLALVDCSNLVSISKTVKRKRSAGREDGEACGELGDVDETMLPGSGSSVDGKKRIKLGCRGKEDSVDLLDQDRTAGSSQTRVVPPPPVVSLPETRSMPVHRPVNPASTRRLILEPRRPHIDINHRPTSATQARRGPPESESAFLRHLARHHARQPQVSTTANSRPHRPSFSRIPTLSTHSRNPTISNPVYPQPPAVMGMSPRSKDVLEIYRHIKEAPVSNQVLPSGDLVFIRGIELWDSVIHPNLAPILDDHDMAYKTTGPYYHFLDDPKSIRVKFRDWRAEVMENPYKACILGSSSSDNRSILGLLLEDDIADSFNQSYSSRLLQVIAARLDAQGRFGKDRDDQCRRRIFSADSVGSENAEELCRFLLYCSNAPNVDGVGGWFIWKDKVVTYTYDFATMSLNLVSTGSTTDGQLLRQPSFLAVATTFQQSLSRQLSLPPGSIHLQIRDACPSATASMEGPLAIYFLEMALFGLNHWHLPEEVMATQDQLDLWLPRARQHHARMLLDDHTCFLALDRRLQSFRRIIRDRNLA